MSENTDAACLSRRTHISPTRVEHTKPLSHERLAKNPALVKIILLRNYPSTRPSHQRPGTTQTARQAN